MYLAQSTDGSQTPYSRTSVASVRRALRLLIQAKRSLQLAGNDFEGYRSAAISAIDQGITHCHVALSFVQASQMNKSGA